MLRSTMICALAFTAACEPGISQDNVTAREPNRIAVDLNQEFQSISGWEFTTRVWEMDKPNNAYSGEWLNYRDKIIDGLANDIGFNRIRLEIRSGAENPVDYWGQFVAGNLSYTDLKAHFYEKINDNDNPDVADPKGFQWSAMDYHVENLVLPLREALKARGERLYVVLNYVDFKRPSLATNLWHARKPDEYAELIEAAFIHLRDKYDLVPDAFEVILEPENTRHWRGKEIGNGLVAVAKRLDALGIDPDYIAPSTTRSNNAAAYFDAIAWNKEAMERLDVFSYHRYDGANSARKAMPKIVERAEKAGIPTAMLEFTEGGVSHLFDDLTIGQVVAWQQYGVPYVAIAADPKRTRQLPLTPAPKIIPLSEVFRNVRRGAVRLDAKTVSGNARGLAFKNKDGGFVVFALAAGDSVIEIEGAPAGEYEYTVAAGNDIKSQPPINVGDGELICIITKKGDLATLRQKTDS